MAAEFPPATTMAIEDSSEWEYEYDETETEVCVYHSSDIAWLAHQSSDGVCNPGSIVFNIWH